MRAPPMTPTWPPCAAGCALAATSRPRSSNSGLPSPRQPDHRDSLSGLGRALRMAGDAKAAGPYLKAAADLDALELLMQSLISPGAPTDPRLLHELAPACEALRRFPEARCWYRLALRYDPDADRTRRRSRPSSMPRPGRPRHPGGRRGRRRTPR